MVGNSNIVQQLFERYPKERENMREFTHGLIEGGGFLAPTAAPIMKAIQASGGKFLNLINTRFGKAYLIEDPATGQIHRYYEDEILNKLLPQFGPAKNRPATFMDWLFNRGGTE